MPSDFFHIFLQENTGGNTLPLQLLSFWAELNSSFGRLQVGRGMALEFNGVFQSLLHVAGSNISTLGTSLFSPLGRATTTDRRKKLSEAAVRFLTHRKIDF